MTNENPINETIIYILASKYEVQKLENRLAKKKLALKKTASQAVINIIKTNNWSIQKTAKALSVPLSVFYKITGGADNENTANQVSQEMVIKTLGDILELQKNPGGLDLECRARASGRRKKRASGRRKKR